ncbi:ArsR/SmtB family transcription factor [Fundicoccus culcitae]|uniref:Helix-turn-helix domain-containing protein n=1 Tax=Fundicoccus culcitae TaxID=2969821 RepID=A0ABY5P9V6_9LACT|nr:ArsR family transcriptional regulator [Fundicoccus culcitae]UUX35386.1 helix-turn-helix domain-containing protein [Fundicoccus culcitae]
MELDLSTHSLKVYEALASQTRLDILNFIGPEEKSISEISEFLSLSNAIISRHVQQLEDAGIVSSIRGRRENRNKKLVSMNIDQARIVFPFRIYYPYDVHTLDVKLGQYIDFAVSPTCGLATTTHIIGDVDDERTFMHEERSQAELLWFKDGFVEYKIPNPLVNGQEPKLLDINLEIASEFPLSNNKWPSDISVYINDHLIGIHTVQGNYSDIRGRLNPDWWHEQFSQYGEILHIRINRFDTAFNGIYKSEISLNHLNLNAESFIRLKLAIDKNAVHKGGLTIFGKGFGNHEQNIALNLYYVNQSEKTYHTNDFNND